jgi:hypothetical protein
VFVTSVNEEPTLTVRLSEPPITSVVMVSAVQMLKPRSCDTVNCVLELMLNVNSNSEPMAKPELLKIEAFTALTLLVKHGLSDVQLPAICRNLRIVTEPADGSLKLIAPVKVPEYIRWRQNSGDWSRISGASVFDVDTQCAPPPRWTTHRSL